MAACPPVGMPFLVSISTQKWNLSFFVCLFLRNEFRVFILVLDAY